MEVRLSESAEGEISLSAAQALEVHLKHLMILCVFFQNAPNVEAVAAMRRRRVRAVRNHPNLEDLFSHFFSMDDPFWE